MNKIITFINILTYILIALFVFVVGLLISITKDHKL